MINRRHFLRNIGLAGATLSIPFTAPASVRTDYGPLILLGKVSASGKGIAGVAVTDGINLTTTSEDGRYELPSNNTAEFVYISIPAGYHFPAKQGCAAFYQRISGKTGSFNADFTLDALGSDDTKHQFVVWADTQMISKEDATLLKTQSAPDLKNLVKSLPAGTLIHGIGCGDLVWDKFELYADYKEALEITGVPFFNVIGNHDIDLDARTDDYSSVTFKKQFGPTYYSFNRGKIHYVTLDDVFFIGKNKEYIGYITETQLKWLEQDLALVSPGSTVVVSMHIPSDTGAARRYDKKEELGGTVSNRKQLYKILEPFNVHIMSGHTHVNEKVVAEKRIEHVHGTVCGAWWTGPICTDGSPTGYAVYEVNGPEIEWYYKSTGLPREHQLRIYGKGKSAARPEAVIANVWNWDPAWKVEWFEDGKSRGAMEQKMGLDPMAVELHGGPQLPVKHKWVDPTLTDHLFECTPSAGAKEISVRATDRFGRIYEEKITV